MYVCTFGLKMVEKSCPLKSGFWQVDVQCARPAIPRAEKNVTLVGWWVGYIYHTIGPEGVRIRETLLVELFPPPPIMVI